MEKFKPKDIQTFNFIDPLMAVLSEDASNYKDSYINSTLDSNYTSHIQKTNLTYEELWQDFILKLRSSKLNSLAINGELNLYPFRSVCWRVFLGILPRDLNLWFETLQEKRRCYEQLKEKILFVPIFEDHMLDPLLNNPLSQDEQSPWNQYFEATELKRMIQQDVIRAFPEIDFFQSTEVHEMMINILFCYAKNSPISYRQEIDVSIFLKKHIKTLETFLQSSLKGILILPKGMHEILAPFIYVLHSDIKHCESSSAELNEAIEMFNSVMKGLEVCYELGESKYCPSRKNELVETVPFSKPPECRPTSYIVEKLNTIHDSLLKRHDPDLYSHLNSLEISPQLYGIRWIRLLFGREFNMNNLLYIWDALFSDESIEFPLIDYFTVGMLIAVREKLLTEEYATCLSFLMRFPSVDCKYIIALALHLRNPEIYKAPLQCPSLVPENTKQCSTGVLVSYKKPSKGAYTEHYMSRVRSQSLEHRNSGSSSAENKPALQNFTRTFYGMQKNMLSTKGMKELKPVEKKVNLPIDKESASYSSDSSEKKSVNKDVVLNLDDLKTKCLCCAAKLSHQISIITDRLNALNCNDDILLQAIEDINEAIMSLQSVDSACIETYEHH